MKIITEKMMSTEQIEEEEKKPTPKVCCWIGLDYTMKSGNAAEDHPGDCCNETYGIYISPPSWGRAIVL